MLPLPAAFEMVMKRSIQKVTTVNRHPINTGTIKPPKYIRGQVPIGFSRPGKKKLPSFPTGCGVVKFDSEPRAKRQMIYPMRIHTTGAIQEMEFPLFLG